MSYNIQPFVESVKQILFTHALDHPGAYRRWNWAGSGARDLGLNAYGCADAANLLYTINHFPSPPAERVSWVETLRGLQDSRSGLFIEATHHPIHTTAHCVAALELFDALPIHPLHELAELRDPARMETLLESLDWNANPWRESHRGAGLYAALVLAGEVTPLWQERYFAWLERENDPATGLWRRGCVEPVIENRSSGADQAAGATRSRFPHLAGSFHYLFNHEYAHQPHPHPAALVDTCLEMRCSDPYPLGRAVGFAEVDWVFCLTRAVRQSGHRFGEVRAALEEFAASYIPYLLSLDPVSDEGLNDLHLLFGAACCLAELQSALPGQLRSDRPLRLVLDRRPFI